MKQEFTILLVDDREENLISLEDLLEADNRKFIKAKSGNAALKAVLKNDNIGLIMLDVQMPDMDGFEVAKLLKANPRTKDISIIFVTAISKDERYVLQGFEEGAVDYLYKPLDIQVTLAKVAVFEKLYFYQRELKQTAAELAKINKQLEKFVYIVAHDLKAPLSGMITMLSVLKFDAHVAKDSRTKNYTDMLYSASNQLADMINSILDYSRQSTAQQTIEEVNVMDMVTSTWQMLYPQENMKIVVATELPTFYTRKLKLMQVFQNLLSNAVKYNDKENGVVEIGCEDKGAFYEFYVKDNGQGISEDDKASLFQLFHKGSNRSNGDTSTGVGLNLLKVLVEEQGGKIGVDTKKGKGSKFWFEWKK